MQKEIDGRAQIASVGERTINLVDSSRNRPVKIEVWYPIEETEYSNDDITELPFVLEPTVRDAAFKRIKHPMVCLSHGTGGNRFGLAWLAIKLAQKGYFVAAVDHWGNTFDNKIPEYFVKVWERPLDIQFMVTSLLEDDEIGRLIDDSKIGAAGFSLGGYTIMALAGAEIDYATLMDNSKTFKGRREFIIPEYGNLAALLKSFIKNKKDLYGYVLKDNRIKAFVAMAPALGLGFSREEQFAKIDSSILIIGAEKDRMTPIKTNAKNYYKLIREAQYREIEGKVGHYIFMNVAGEDLQQNAKRYFRDAKKVNRSIIHNQLSEMIAKYFNEVLSH